MSYVHKEVSMRMHGRLDGKRDTRGVRECDDAKGVNGDNIREGDDVR
jgi:hypothetical protein